MFSKIQIDWRKKEWHITTDVRTGSGVSGKKPRKKCCGNMELMKLPSNKSVLTTGQTLIPTGGFTITNYRRHLQNKIRRASPAEKETLREEKNGVTERITELRKRLKYADGIEKRSAHIDDCLNQIHDTVENQRSNQNGRTDRKREDALR